MPQPMLPMTLTTSLGADKLRFRSMRATEELARLFEFEVQALAEEADIDGNKLLGKPASVKLMLPDNTERYFHGLVSEVSFSGMLERGADYRLVLRPWLWLLTQRQDSRIFQNKNVVDIAKEVFGALGVDFDYKFELNGTPPSYEYCVQYRETDFAFVSRLFEREGLYYYFKHDVSKHTLMVVNAPSKHSKAPGEHKFQYRPIAADRALDFEPITRWSSKRALQPGKWVLTDYNFKTPTTSLKVDTKSNVPKSSEKLEIYDYPGLYTEAAGGQDYVNLRREEGDTRYSRVSGEGSLRTMACGYQFELLDHPDKAENISHLAISTVIEMGFGGYESGAGDDYFRCRFAAVPASVPFRPQRITPKARVEGPHTAKVVGPSGEEIHVDKYGRVKVQFHWDRLGKNDANSSCYVRVAQPSAGKGFGAVWTPRIGHEVVVQFLEGDPDRPLITGSVYNETNMPPYVLPDQQTVSTFKGRSSPSGGASDFNEMRFDDKAGDEYVLFQAQKDQLEIVKANLYSEVKRDEHRMVGNDRKEKIGGEHHVQIDGHGKLKIGGMQNTTVEGDILIKTEAQHSLDAGKDITAKSGLTYSVNAGTDMHVKVGQNFGAVAGMNVHLDGGMNVVIEGGMMISLKAGPSTIVLGPDGVSITGPMVKINSGGAAGSGNGADPVAPTKPDEPEDPTPPKDPLPHH